MAVHAATPETFVWPAEVVEFARGRGLDRCLGPILEMTHRLFPTARRLTAGLVPDPELRDEWSVIMDLSVPEQDVPDYVRAVREWDAEMIRIQPQPHDPLFVLMLNRGR